MSNGPSVIQGCFPHGLPRIAAAHAPAVQPFAGNARPAWVQARIGATVGSHGAPQPVQRLAAPPAQAIQPHSLHVRNALPLPSHLAPSTPVHGGQPLPAAVRQRMEGMFRASFNDVRIHVGPQAQALGATAFTHGSHIHFAPGEYAPETTRGRTVLAQQLAHVVQQRSGRARNPFGSGVALVHDPQLDSEAQRFGQLAARDGGATVQKLDPLTIGLGVAAVAAVGGAVAYAVSNCLSRGPDPIAQFKSMQGLKDLRARTRTGGDQQGTTALMQSGGAYYLVEQDNCYNCQVEMAGAGITYVDSGARHKGWHAEMRMLAYAHQHGKSLAGATIWVNKDICKSCAAELALLGVHMAVPTETDDPYDDWVHWKEMAGLGYLPSEAAYQGRKRGGWGSRLEEEESNIIASHYGDISNLDRSARRRFTGTYG